MPTNDTPYEMSVGPDADGKYLIVEPGADYEAPAPPTQVEPQPAEDPAPEAAPADSKPVAETPPAPPAPKNVKSAPANTEGDSA